MLLGILSDTHGLLRPEVLAALEGVEHILHAGDVGELDILTELETIAPVTAVWGNTDDWEVRGKVREVAEVEVGGVKVGVMHGHQLGSPHPSSVAARFPEAGLVVFGHTHVPVVEQVGSVLAINPGSVGPRRFRLPVSLAIASVEDGLVTARMITLDV